MAEVNLDVFEVMVGEAQRRMIAGTVDEEQWWSTAVPLIEAGHDGTVGDVVGRLNNVARTILGVLDFVPRSTHGMVLHEKLTKEGVAVPEARAAINGLVFAERIEEINGWWFKHREPVELSWDDVQWLHGSGRYSQ
jgi:hypothetical protein